MRDKFYPISGQIIYSIWDGYLEPPYANSAVLSFIGGRDIVKLHTSGHANAKSIAEVIKTVNPKIIISMHIESADSFSKMHKFAAYAKRVCVLKDGERLSLNDI